METLKDFCGKFGIQEEIILDGQIHNIKDTAFKGWYIGSEEVKDSLKYVTFTLHDWKANERYYFKEEPENLSEEKKKEFLATLKERQDLQDKQIKETENNVATLAENEFLKLNSLSVKHPYLESKKIKGDKNTRVVKNSFGSLSLVIPMKDSEGKMWGMQTIDTNGEKSFLPGQRVEGLYYQFGTFTSDIIFICEGYATGESIHLATDKCVLAAFSSSNLQNVGSEIRRLLPEKKLVFCADNDQWGQKNWGLIHAKKAAAKCRAQVIVPTFPDVKTKPTDYNDLHVLEGLSTVKDQIFRHDFVSPHRIIPTENSGFHRTELRNGKEVLIPAVDDLRDFFERKNKYIVHEQSEVLHIFNGKYFESVGDKYIEFFAETHFDPKPTNKIVGEFKGKILRTNIVKETWFERSVFKKINFANGVLDLKTKELLPHDSGLGFKYVLPYNYDPTATAPIFENFLDQLTLSKDLSKLILEYFGYALSNDPCWAQKCLVLEGEGSNGKSTLLNVFKKIVGEKNYSPLHTGEFNSERNRVMLEGKLANIAEETPNKTLLDSSTLKNLVTGGEVQARHMYKPPYIFKNRAKLIFSCNELQETTDLTHGFFRRFLIIKFKAVFSKELGNVDYFIEDKLSNELAGIFNLCMDAYAAMKARGFFLDVKEAHNAVDEYIHLSDPLPEWLDTHIKVYHVGNGADEKRVNFTDLYLGFAAFLEVNGFRKITSNQFSRRLKIKIPNYEERLVTGKDQARKSVKQIKAMDFDQ